MDACQSTVQYRVISGLDFDHAQLLSVAILCSDMISQRTGGRSGSGVQLGTGRGTLRLRSKGPATVEELVRVHIKVVWEELYYSQFLPHLRCRSVKACSSFSPVATSLKLELCVCQFL